jgi:CubicO group peptidase (beta-lactamase class C family)
MKTLRDIVLGIHQKIKRTGTIGLILFLASVIAVAADSTNFSSKADAYLLTLAREEQFSGTVLVATNGNVVFANGYGMANREYDIANTTNTIFRLGSVTKQFTAMCVLILQEEHKLNVTNLVSNYVEDCPEAWRAITIHHLLTHTAGIPSFTGFPDNMRFERLPTTVAATVQRFKDKPLDFEPGTKMRYSNSGYVLLGYIIEKVAGKSYEEFLTERVFRPLGMKHSGYDHPATLLPNRAAGYTRSGTNILNCIPFAMDTPHAAGALYSTVVDLLTWDQALYSERLVSASALGAMFTEFKGKYCYGWFHDNIAGRGIYSHGGGISGFRTHVIRFPKERVYIAVLSNFESANPSRIADKIGSFLFNSEQ